MSHSPGSLNLTPPKGILRNAPHKVTEPNSHVIDGTEQLDRKKVLENTRLNAHLLAVDEGDKIRRQIAEKKEKNSLNNNNNNNNNINANNGADAHLQWDEVNLYLTEQDKSALMKIDEPKTPYEGGVDPNNDYYRSDNEDDDEGGDLEDFSLGEPLDNEAQTVSESLNGGEIVQDNEEEEEEEGDKEEELTAEERHKKFEEMRKNHYHLKGEVLKHPVPVEDEDDE